MGMDILHMLKQMTHTELGCEKRCETPKVHDYGGKTTMAAVGLSHDGGASQPVGCKSVGGHSSTQAKAPPPL